MPWLAVSLQLEASQAEKAADALLEAGALSVEITDAQAGSQDERPLFDEPRMANEPETASNRMWRSSRLIALFDAQAGDVLAMAHAAIAAAGVGGRPDLHLAPVAERDWVRASQEQFVPIRISPHLWIVPSWCEAPDPTSINLRLDPGLAFGTGSHPTTRQCLCWLEANLPRGAAVLDYGCGSGVLGIAAKRLGAARVVGVDIDPRAVEASRENASRNAVEIEFTGPDVVPRGPYDVVVANILANPLKLLAPLLATFTRAGGDLLLAGILAHQATEVVDAYAPWYELRVAEDTEGWTCLTGKRKLRT